LKFSAAAAKLEENHNNQTDLSETVLSLQQKMTKNANQPQTVSTPGDTLSVTNYTIPVSMKSNLFYKRSNNCE
jgi:hypothetical protein